MYLVSDLIISLSANFNLTEAVSVLFGTNVCENRKPRKVLSEIRREIKDRQLDVPVKVANV